MDPETESDFEFVKTLPNEL